MSVAIPEQHFAILLGLEQSGRASAVGLDLDGLPLTYDEFESLGRFLGRLRDMSAWMLGDWLVFGEGAYGERIGQAVEATGRSKSTLMNYASVARRVVRSRRREDLSWSHHEAIAALPPPEQDHWLERSARERWSVEELRGALRALPPSAQGAAEPSPRRQIEAAERDAVVHGTGFVVDGERVPPERVTVVRASTLQPCPTCRGRGTIGEESA